MKKFLRFMIIMLVTVAALIMILTALEPTDITVTRSTVIKAPKEAVFQHISLFHNWPHWSPWYRLDTTMKIEYSGTDGQPGSAYHWTGNEKVGEGKMKNTGVNGLQMSFELNIIRPFESKAQGYLKAEDTAGMTKATWSLTTHVGRPRNAMQVFINMDKLLGKDFENGLNNMKTYLEK